MCCHQLLPALPLTYPQISLCSRFLSAPFLVKFSSCSKENTLFSSLNILSQLNSYSQLMVSLFILLTKLETLESILIPSTFTFLTCNLIDH